MAWHFPTPRHNRVAHALAGCGLFPGRPFGTIKPWWVPCWRGTVAGTTRNLISSERQCSRTAGSTPYLSEPFHFTKGPFGMSYRDRETLFIFLDESGNFDFSKNGTRYWSLTALCTFHPVEGREAFLDLMYSLADEGMGQECLHATEDSQAVRDRVFDLILGLPKYFDVHFSIAEKKKVPPALYEDHESSFYAYVCKRLIAYIVANEKYSAAKRFVIVFSSIFKKPKHEAVEGELKSQLKRSTALPFCIYFRNTKFDVNCQIADYCSWALSVKWTRNEQRPYALIGSKVGSELSLFGEDGPDYY
jgi:hypothetical protein